MPHVRRAFRFDALKAVSTNNGNIPANGNASSTNRTRDTSPAETIGSIRTTTSTKNTSALI